MQLTLKHSLPFVTAELVYHGGRIEVPHVLVDTGSARTVFSADKVSKIGLLPEPEDILVTVRGVGGVEVVFIREVERVQIGRRALSPFEIEVSGMDYGFDINGILGMDFLIGTGAIIDLQRLQLGFFDSAEN